MERFIILFLNLNIYCISKTNKTILCYYFSINLIYDLVDMLKLHHYYERKEEEKVTEKAERLVDLDLVLTSPLETWV